MPMRCTSISATAAVTGSRSSRSPPTHRSTSAQVQRTGAEAVVVAGHPVQGNRLLHHRLRARRQVRRRQRVGGQVGRVVKARQLVEPRARASRRRTRRSTRVERKVESKGSSESTARQRLRQQTSLERGKPVSDSSRARGRASTTIGRRGRCFDSGRQIEAYEVLAERLREIRPLQREVHDRLQESQLVAGVVPDAVDFAGVERPRAQQLRAGRWSAESRPVRSCAVASSAAKMSGVRM